MSWIHKLKKNTSYYFTKTGMKIESIYKTFPQDPTSVTDSVEKRGLHIWKYLYFYNLYLQPLLRCVNNLLSVGVSLNSCHVTLWPSHRASQLWGEWCLVTASILNRTCRIKCFLEKYHDLFIRKEKWNSFLLINQTTQANIISISSMSAHNLRQFTPLWCIVCKHLVRGCMSLRAGATDPLTSMSQEVF